ncbi:MAG TPA: HDIG domain-containing protein [Anaerolineales bacterium]|nr:HDIG domain-containing protein [Anaerolineales bacterium]
MRTLHAITIPSRQSVFKQLFARRAFVLSFLLLILGGGIFIALIMPKFGSLAEASLYSGQVAPYDIEAPYDLTYESQVLTQRQQELAANAVAPVYSSPDTEIARKQLERLSAALAYISSVRADRYASSEQKLADMAALEYMQTSHDTGLAILSLSEARWQVVYQEAIVVLEQVMRSTVRENRLDDIRRGVPTLISLSLSEEQADITADLVTAFIVPNSIYNEEMTEVARQQARQNTPPVMRSLVAGQNIVQRGQVIAEQDIEVLEKYGLAQPEERWQDILSALIITAVVSALITIYLRRRGALVKAPLGLRSLVVLLVLFLLFLLAARIVIPGRTVIPYVYPLMAYGLTVAALFGAEMAIISSLPLAILAAYQIPSALDLTAFYTLSSIFGIFALQRARRITDFFTAGAAIAISGALVATTYRLLQPTADVVGLATLAGASIVNGVASASISLLLHYFLAQILDMTTGLQLVELSRPDHPLLQFILRNAPGTYQHSLQLANLVEQAAERIGANGSLARVGALYHDAGKALNPYFFIENQPTGDINPHDDLDPTVSAATIIRHVTDGVTLARKYRLPRRLDDFILEHHGTLITRYQYVRAVEAKGGDESQVDQEAFRYPGPRPQSRETALLMLADGAEARMRAERPKDAEELRALIRGMIESRRSLGQLDETHLTLRDLDTIVESFTTTLRGAYHARIQYPQLQPAQDTAPEAPNKDAG